MIRGRIKIILGIIIITISIISCGKKGDPYPKKPSICSTILQSARR